MLQTKSDLQTLEKYLENQMKQDEFIPRSSQFSIAQSLSANQDYPEDKNPIRAEIDSKPPKKHGSKISTCLLSPQAKKDVADIL